MAMDCSALFRIGTEFRVRYESGVPCVAMTWRGYHTGPSFRACNEDALSLIRRHGASRLFCDAQAFLLIAATEQAWLVEDWLPRAIDAGVRRCALVTPAFYFNRVAVDSVVKLLASPKLNVAFFESAENARAWLASGPAN